MKWLARIALLVVATIISAELFLQAAALLVRDRSVAASEGEITILCVGDSHTYGTGMEPGKSYPGRLQTELDRVARGRYRVVNRGIPGFTTTMVRRRLPGLIEQHQPQMIWLWVGVNDAWNRAEVDALEQRDGAAVPGKGALESLADQSRLVKLARARAYGALAVEQHARERVKIYDSVRTAVRPGGGIRFEMDGVVQEVLVVPMADEPAEESAERMANNYRAITALGRERDIGVGLITYPVPYPWAALANRSIRSVAEEVSVPLVDSVEVMSGFPDEVRFQTTWGAHPTALHYSEIAKAVAIEVLAHLPPPE